MLCFFLIYIATILWGIKVNTKRTSEYVDIEHTQAVKGIFILLVFFSHFNLGIAYTAPMDKLYERIVNFFGQTMVTMFLFYSGYGVMESIRKKGSEYINGIPKKRILTTVIRFDTAVVIYIIVYALLGQFFTPSHYVLALLGWESVGNSHWYIFDIILLYFLTFISFKITYFFPRQRTNVAAMVVLVTTCVGVLFLIRHSWIKPIWWYDTIVCYSLGIFYSLYRERIEKIVNRNVATWIVAMVLLWGAFLFFWKIKFNIWMNLAANITFTIAFTFFTMRILFKNKVLIWCGKHLFEIFILHRLPLFVLKVCGLDQVNVYMYFIGAVVITLALIFPFKYLTDWIVKFVESILEKRCKATK